MLDEEVLIGIILGDAWLERKRNARLRFEQSYIRTEFFNDVYSYFVEYTTPTYPKLRERYDKRTNKIYKSWHFSTRAIPELIYYYEMFYNEDGKKIIPIDIEKYLTPKALAFWIMSDGYKYNRSVALATNGFSIADNKLLMEALNRKFGFESWIIKDHGLPTIFIPKRNLVLLQEMVKPYMHNTLLYKIHL